MIPKNENFKEMVKRWLDIAEPNREKPVLAKVDKINSGSGKNKYSLTAVVLDAATYEETDRIIGDVAISPIWAGTNGEGIYAPPAKGMIIVIDFIEGSAAFPFVSSIWGQDYNCGEFAENELTFVKGDSYFKISSGGLFALVTQGGSLKTILEKIIDKTKSIITIGPPPQHTVSPDSIAALEAIKTDINQLLGE